MSTANYNHPFTCSATRAIKSFFDSRNWPTNLLWLTIAAILQMFVIGGIFLFGYGASALQARAGLPGNNNPDIDSNRLGDYFTRGLWPFLVYFIASTVLSIVIAIPFLVFVAILLFAVTQLGEAGVLLVVVLLFPLALAMQMLMLILIGPIAIRAMICQDFQKSFDRGWYISFIKLTYRDVAVSALTFTVLGLAICLAGSAIACVGILPAIGLLSGAAMHLLAQWYELFLSRGGEPVEPATDTIVDATLV